MKKNFYDLQEYITYLEAIGDLTRVKTEVDPILEITEIYSRVAKEKGPALVFENNENIGVSPEPYIGKTLILSPALTN